MGTEIVGDSLEEILQETDTKALVVRTTGPVETQALPSRITAMYSTSVSDATVESILGKDPQRQRARILASVQPIYLGVSKTIVGSTTGFTLPVGIVLLVEGIDQIFARCATGSSSAIISIETEAWAATRHGV